MKRKLFPARTLGSILSVALCTCALACSASTVAEHSKPEKKFVIFDGDSGKKILKQCSRSEPENVSGYWKPTEKDVQELEKHLPEFLKENGWNALAQHFSESGRQYVGVIRNGKKLIYLNAFPVEDFWSKSNKGWEKEPVLVCDGGPQFWGVEYDVESKTFQNLAFNGGG